TPSASTVWTIVPCKGLPEAWASASDNAWESSLPNAVFFVISLAPLMLFYRLRNRSNRLLLRRRQIRANALGIDEQGVDRCLIAIPVIDHARTAALALAAR